MNILTKLGLQKEDKLSTLSVLGECKVMDILSGSEILYVTNDGGDKVRLDHDTRLAVANGIKKISRENSMEAEEGEKLGDFVMRAVIMMSIKDYNELISLREQVGSL